MTKLTPRTSPPAARERAAVVSPATTSLALCSWRSARRARALFAIGALLSLAGAGPMAAQQTSGSSSMAPAVPSAPPGTSPDATAAPKDAAPMPRWPSTASPPEVAGAPVKTTTSAPRPPAQKIKVNVWDLDPESQELHLDIKGNVLSLSVEQAVDIALQRNLAIVLQRYIRNEARLSLLAAYGIYDLTLNATAQESYAKAPVITLGTPSDSRIDTFTLALSQLIPSGGTVSLNYSDPRTNTYQGSAAGAFFLFPAAYWEPSVTVGLTQPLLSGFGLVPTERNILQARNGSDSNRCLFEFTAITNAVTVIDDYWALVNAREQLVVAQEALQLARDLNERNRIQVQVGTLAPLEMAQSEAAIATDEENIITAQAAVGDAADALRQVMNLPPDLWGLDILPVTQPETDTIQIDLDSSIKTALDSRPEVKFEVLKVDSAKITSTVAHNATLPTLNLTSNMGFTSIGGTFGSSFGAIGAGTYPAWTVGLNLSLPLQNRNARANAASADLSVKQFSWELDQQRKQVLIEVRKAVRGVETAAKQIDAAHAARQFQERSLDAERKKYENGMSTSFLITQVEVQLTTAKQTEVNAVTTYRTALTEYYRSIGKLLPELGVEVQDPKEPVNRFIWHKADWWKD
jgi:outer membrane protein